MKSKRGGKRKGAGRKPLDDKKIPLTLWIIESQINQFGKDNLKDYLYEFLQTKINRI